jgi:hypothetical protein
MVVFVEIVMLEKLDCILSKRATRPIYMKVQVRLNAISPYQSQQSSPAIQDISVSGHTRHLRLRPYETHLRLRPVYAIVLLDIYLGISYRVLSMRIWTQSGGLRTL